MIGNRKQIIQWFLTVLANNKVRHVESRNGKVNISVLFGVISSKAFEIYEKDRRHIVNLNFLHSLLMTDTLIAIPCICLGQVLRFVELSEAVLDTHDFR